MQRPAQFDWLCCTHCTGPGGAGGGGGAGGPGNATSQPSHVNWAEEGVVDPALVLAHFVLPDEMLVLPTPAPTNEALHR